MKVAQMNDKNLHFTTLKLVANERESGVLILQLLREIDRRKLYSDHKCSSLFDYCVRILGYSEASAQRRIVAARLVAEIPEVEKKVTEGSLTLTNISQANQYFRENDISTPKGKKEVLSQIEGMTKKECEKKLFELSGKEKKASEKCERISKSESLVSIILSDETLSQVEKVRDLLGKNQTMDEVLLFMTKAAIREVERVKFKKTERPKSLSLEKEGRTPGSALKREVYDRDRKCVQCGSIRNLNFDHHLPYALGGKTKLANLRLLCSNCNQRERIKVFGISLPGPSG